MAEVSPTRSELIKLKLQIALAQQGCNLLKEKRDALLVEFMAVMDETLRLSSLLERAVANAQYALTVAKAVDGGVTVKSVALATKGEITIDLSGTKIMGVAIPVVQKKYSPVRSLLTRGYSVTGASSRIDETAENFEKVLDILIENADVETRLKRLGDEIQKTNRRVNALEQIVIPETQKQMKYIRMTLEERAREDLFRLKRVKRKLELKKLAMEEKVQA
ncbi:MAG TPA: V-type ATP synthase subunit D [Elusimicrobia bacterium]|jgi:V/A-type H+-transporting ATPase subunit D|nr:V-type ATP synthase subunit D [Elusimicrobiota bacterium]